MIPNWQFFESDLNYQVSVSLSEAYQYSASLSLARMILIRGAVRQSAKFSEESEDNESVTVCYSYLHGPLCLFENNVIN